MASRCMGLLATQVSLTTRLVGQVDLAILGVERPPSLAANQCLPVTWNGCATVSVPPLAFPIQLADQSCPLSLFVPFQQRGPSTNSDADHHI